MVIPVGYPSSSSSRTTRLLVGLRKERGTLYLENESTISKKSTLNYPGAVVGLTEFLDSEIKINIKAKFKQCTFGK